EPPSGRLGRRLGSEKPRAGGFEMSTTTFPVRLLAAVVVATAVVPTTALAAIDAYLKIDGLKGDSKDAAHPGSIEVMSWSWGASRDGASMATQRGKEPPRPIGGSFTIKKTTDSASPSFFKAAVNGRHFPKMVLYVRKAGGEQETAYTFEDCTVAHLSSMGPTESVTFEYGRLGTSTTPVPRIFPPSPISAQGVKQPRRLPRLPAQRSGGERNAPARP